MHSHAREKILKSGVTNHQKIKAYYKSCFTEKSITLIASKKVQARDTPALHKKLRLQGHVGKKIRDGWLDL